MIKKFFVTWLLMGFAFTAAARTGVFPQEDFDQLSYGLYWFGANNQYVKASADTQDGCAYYDPTKPTLIFVHGWQPDRIESLDRFTYFGSDANSPDVDFANLWNAHGYNVGVLFWDQFADENEVTDAEAKIWSATGPRNMRWLDSHGDYHSGPSQNVTQLLTEQYRIAMAHYQGSDIRIAGHSLGNQLALTITNQLATMADNGQINTRIVPERVSLLDPFYSNHSKSYLNDEWVGEAARKIAFRLKDRDIAIDSYRTSLVTSTVFVGDENKELQNAIAFEEELTSFFNQTQQSAKHGAAVWLYLWSIDYPTPVVEDNSLPGLSAATTNEQVKLWMNTTDHLRQIAGGHTKTPQDNVFETRSEL